MNKPKINIQELMLCALMIIPLVWNNAKAEDVECFSAGKSIYHHHAHNLVFGGADYGYPFLLFRENKTHKLVYITGDCVVMEWSGNKWKKSK